jgi:hypothetical protein
MRVETNSSGAKIFVRQSWLNDALMCPERARLTELHPEMRRENDSALMGTAVHAGIEQVLNNGLPASDIGEFCVGWFRSKKAELEAEGRGVTITNTDPKNWNTHISSMANAWVKDILPFVPAGGQTEAQFCVAVARIENSLFESLLHPSGSYELFFEGTADYVHASGIWDWKTAARKYYEAEKQSQNIQSAVYATAFTKLGVVDYAVNFNFGVMIRNASSTGQIVNVTRTERHADWIVNQATSLVNSVLLARRYLPNQRQIMNDQHHLCSERWCPVWSKCKGSILSDTTDTEVSNG